METAWVLERSYKFTRAQVSDAILGLMATGNLVMEASEDVAHAALAYNQGGLDFARPDDPRGGGTGWRYTVVYIRPQARTHRGRGAAGRLAPDA